jgi:gliding motility-associated-like protein
MRSILAFLLCFLIHTFSVSQIVNSSFVAPDTVCINQTFTIQNTTTGSIVSTTYWNFCSPNYVMTQVTNLGASASLAWPTFCSVQMDNGNYYIFITNNNPSSITRYSYGNNLNNAPVITNLGNFSANLPSQMEGIRIEKEGTNWYGLAVGGQFGSAIVRLNFGASLSNMPTLTNMGNLGGLAYPVRLQLIESGGNRYGFTVNHDNNTITRFNFGNSLANVPVATNLGNIGGLSGPCDIALACVSGTWYGFVIGDGNTITRLNFGASLLNTPTGTNLGNPGGITNGRSLFLEQDCNGLKGWIGNGSGNNILRLAFPSGPTGPLVTTNLGNIAGFNYVHSIDKYRVGDTIYTYIPNTFSNSLSRIKYANCVSTSIPSSTLQNLPALSYSVAGTYTISLFNNELDYNRSTYCKTIVVSTVGVIGAVASPSNGICSGGSATLTANGSSSFTWNPGPSTLNPFVVNPLSSTVYTVISTPTLGCQGVKTVTVNVVPTPTLNLNATSFTICSGGTTSLSSAGATNYTWNPGNLTGSNVAVSPTATTVYTAIGANGSCTDTKTIQIDVDPNPTVTTNASPSVFCFGNSSTLTASGAITYTWNPGNSVGATVVVTPNATTIYTVVGLNGTCNDTKTIQVTIAPNPTISAYANYTFVCLGESATLAAIGAQTYTWNPGNLVGTPIYPTPTVNTTYTVTGTNSVGCTNTSVVSVTVGTSPTVSVVGPYKTACFGTMTGFVATGAINYTWFPNGPVNLNILSTVAIANTVYTVVGAVGSCTNSATATLIVHPNPTITVVANPSIRCSGSPSSTLSASGATSYAWSPPNFLAAPIGSSVLCSAPVSMCYNVGGANAFGCYSAAIICITVQPTPTINILSIPGVICIGDQASLEASGATTYTWLPTASSNTNIIVTPTTTTTYTLYGQTGACIGNSVITVTVNPTPTLSALVITPTLCVGRSTEIFVSGASSFTWEPGSMFGFSINVTPTVSTTYTVTGTSFNCATLQTVDVTVVQNPSISIFSAPGLTCVDPLQSSTLTAGGANTFTWLPTSTASQSIAVSPSVTSMYTVSGTNSNGCISSNTIALNVDPDLRSSISATRICSGTTVSLSASGAVLYNWMPGNSVLPNVNVSPQENTTYTLTGTNGICSKSNTLAIEVVKNPINEIPEVFTPNDDGKNDLFVIKTETVAKIDIKIFNRWGAMVYSNAEYDNTWNGTANTGMLLDTNKLPQGTYYYIIDIESCDKQVTRGYVVIHY